MTESSKAVVVDLATERARLRGGADGVADDAARARIASDLETTFLVEAAAGTGKTSTLVKRIVAVLATGKTRLDRLVALTFTEAAAGELKLRLRTELERARQNESRPQAERDRLTDCLPHLEQARVGTIHSFCADLLRERPVEAGVDPLFEVAADDAADDLLGRAFDRWFERQLARPSEGIRRILRRRAARDGGQRAVLRAAARELVERRDFPSPWRRDAFDRDTEIDAILTEMTTLGAYAGEGKPDDYFTRSLARIDRFAREATRREAIRGRDHDWLEAELIAFLRDRQDPNHWNWKGSDRMSPRPNKRELAERRAELHARLKAFEANSGADLAPRVRDDLWEVVDDYERLKQRAGCLDFIDLLMRARDLVRDRPAVRRELQERFDYLFVDEFQDTDPLQVEILFLLAAGDPAESDWRAARPVAGKLFLVADPKQSIYRFRRADVALYQLVKQRLLSCGAELLALRVSFRSIPEIQQAVNACFAPLMRGDSPSQAGYVPLEPYRPALEGQPAIVALPVPRPYGDYGKIVNWRINDSLPDAVAAFVSWLVNESGWTVSEREQPEKRIPLQPRHVCLLFRRFRTFGRDVTRGYVRALEARQVPHLLVGGSSFHQREEVETVRNALAAIERPEDELMVFATLHGPLFALADAQLLAFRARFKSLHPFRRLDDDLPAPLAEVGAALGVLRDLHRGRNHRPIAETVSRLLGATRAPAAFAIWPTGEQALANVARLMDLARRAERRGLTSFRAFVERLLDDAERGEASEAPIFEEGTDGVRIMTVHRAKGLEFPVVVLADLTASETPSEPSRYVDVDRRLCAMRLAGCSPVELLEHAEEELARELEEAVRLTYVAATRARDLLVVSAVGDERPDGWLASLNPVLYPPPGSAARPVTRQPPGCPAFGGDSVKDRPDNAARPLGSVVPGLHHPEAGAHSVVWWDPSVLKLGVQESVGLKQQRLLEVDEGSVRSADSERAHDLWQEKREQVRAEARRPLIEVAVASEPAGALGEVEDELPPVRVETTALPGAGERPHGKRFGTLVHTLLAATDLDAERAAVERSAALWGRSLGAPTAEIEAAIETATAALAHPLLRRAAAAARRGACRRETPVTLRLGARKLVEGVVDAAFFEPDPEPCWTVIDFKTDLEIAGRLADYQRQVALYALAIHRATGVRTEGVLLRV